MFGASRWAWGERQQKKKGEGGNSINLVTGFGFLLWHFTLAQ